MATALREVFARFRTKFDDRELKRGERTTNNLTASLKRMAGFIAVGLGVNALRGMISGFREAGDEIDKMSKTIGIGIGALQAWRFAADRSGVETQAFNGSVIRLQRQMLDANRGLESAARSFDRLGVKVTDAAGNLRPVEDVLLDMADPLANLESSSERVGILAELMGRQGARMGPLFAEGASGVQDLLSRFEELGGGIGGDAVQASADLTDAMTDMDTAATSLKSEIGVVLLPALQRLAEGFTNLIRDGRLLRALFGTALVVAVSALIVKVQALGVAGALAGVKTTVAWAGIALVLGGVLLLLDDIITTFEGGDSMISRQITSTEKWFDATRRLEGAWGKVADVLRGIVNLIDQGIGDVLGIFGVGAVDENARQQILASSGGAIDIATAEGRAASRSIQNADPGQRQQRIREALAGARAGQMVGNAGNPLIDSISRAGAEGAAIRQMTIGKIEVNGAQDPEATARAVRRELDRQSRDAEQDLAP